MLGIKVIRA